MKSRPKTMKEPFFFQVWYSWIFYDLWPGKTIPGKTMGSEAPHLLVPGGQRSSSDIENEGVDWFDLRKTMAVRLPQGGYWNMCCHPYDHYWFIYWFSRNHPGEGGSLSTSGIIVKHPSAIPFSDAASHNEESYGSRLRHLPSCTRETRVYLVDLAGIIMWFKVSKNTLFSSVRMLSRRCCPYFYQGIETPFSCITGSERAGMHALAAEQLKEGEHINLSNLAWNAWNVVWGFSNLQIQGI